MKADVLRALAHLPEADGRKGRGSSPWSDERVELLRRLRCLEGLSCSQIAKLLSQTGHKFTRNAVIAKCDRLGLVAPAHLGKQRTLQATRIASRSKAPVGWRKPTKPPELKPALFTPHPPVKGASAVRFDARRWDQCPMFVEGERALADGFVCGAPVTHGSWCEACARLVFDGRLAGERLVA